MAFLSTSQLKNLGFKYLGNNVLISDKASIYNPELISICDNSRIDDFCVISGNITIGRNVHIAVFCNIAGGEQGITLEDFSGLAYGCQIFAQSDDYSGNTLTNPTIPDKFKSEIKKPVFIKKHVIIGTNSVVFPGVTIAEGCSIGSLSLVSKSTLPWGIYVGNPAKRIKDRSSQLLQLEKQYLNSQD